MATISWIDGAGNWTTGTDWSTGSAPGTGDDVTIGSSGDVTVTSQIAQIGSLTLGGTLLFDDPGGTQAISGTVSNSGNLDFDTTDAGGSSLTIGSTLTNTGVVAIGNAGLTAATTVTAAALTNTGTIDLSGGGSALATLNIAGAAPGTLTGAVSVIGDADLEFGSGGITSIASGALLRISGSQARVSIGATTTSNALLGLATNAGTFDLEGVGSSGGIVTTTTGFDNTGVLDVDTDVGVTSPGGSTLTIGGTLTNGGTINIGSAFFMSASTDVIAAGLVNTGTINLDGVGSDQSTLNIAGAAPGTLTGTVSVIGDADLEFGSGGITSIASGALLRISGSQARVSIGATTTSNALLGLATNAGTFDLEGVGSSGGIVTTTTGFDNTGVLDVDTDVGVTSPGGSTLTIGGTLTNGGTINIGSSFFMSASTDVIAAGLVNTGTINLDGVGSDQSTLNIAGAAPGTLTGAVSVIGNADLEFGSGGITSIASGALLRISGSQARVSIGATTTSNALLGLATNAGTFDLEGVGSSGGIVTTTTGFDNTGVLDVDTDVGVTSPGGSTLTIGGTLTNGGTINIGSAFFMSASTDVIAAGLVNTGTINLDGVGSDQSTLNIAGAAPGTLTGAVSVIGNADLEFGSGGITSIASGALLRISGSQARVSIGATTTSNALLGLATNAGTFDLEGVGSSGGIVTTTTGFDNTGVLDVDTDVGVTSPGGSTLTIGGTLTNGGTINIGSAFFMSASTDVIAAGLVNTGTINLDGVGSDQSTLSIAGAAPGTLTGAVSVIGNADLEFGSGGITSIASGALLRISGSQARVSIGATTTSNALLGLATNAGTFDLEGVGSSGGIVTTTTGFDNTGVLDVDTDVGVTSPGGSTLTIGGTLTNGGTINIGSAFFMSASTDVIAAGLVNTGTINLDGVGSDQSTLSIAGAATTSGTFNIGASAALDVTGGNDLIETGGTVTVTGTLTAAAAEISGGLLDYTGAPAADLAISLSGSGTVAFGGAVDSGETVTFGAGGELMLAEPSGFAGTVAGFQGGDTIDVQGIGLAASYSYSGGLLTLLNSTGGTLAQLHLTTPIDNPEFTLVSDSNGGTDVGIVAQGGTVYTGNYSSGIVLKNPATQLPATLAAGSYVTNTTAAHGGDAVYGTGAAAWRLTNYGTVNATQDLSDGVDFVAGGTVTNAASGVISGAGDGVLIGGAAGTVVNFGSVAATGTGGFGVYLKDGGVLTNAASGVISTAATNAVEIANAAGAVANYGTIIAGGTHSTAVSMTDGGSLVNGNSDLPGALIEGNGGLGVYIGDAAGTVVNYGTIASNAAGGFYDVGVFLSAGGSVTNASGGLIDGSGGGVAIGGGSGTVVNKGLIETAGTGYVDGVYLAAGGSVDNLGTISATGGTNGDGVALEHGGVVTNGQKGSKAGLIAGSAVGVLFDGGSAQLTNYGTILGGADGVVSKAATTVIDNFGKIAGTAGYGVYLYAGGSLTNEKGALIKGTTDGVISTHADATILNQGTIEGTGKSGIGVDLIAAGSTLINAGKIVGKGGAAVDMAGADETLIVDKGASFGGAVTDFQQGDTIDFAGVLANSYKYANGVLTLFENGAKVAQLTIATPITNPAFALSSDANGGTDVTVGSSGSGTIFSGTFLNGIVLKNPATEIPATLAAGSYVTDQGGDNGGDAVYGESVAAWNFTNLGRIVGYGTTGLGVLLNAGGIVVNGAGPGSANRGGGAVVIEGYVAVEINAAAGTVFNYATIESTGTYGIGVLLSDGGSVSNGQNGTSGGIIEGGHVAVEVDNGAGTVSNYGSILGTGSAPFAVHLSDGGDLGNGGTGATGALIAGADGIEIDGAAGTVVNFATILGSGSGGYAVLLTDGGSVTNGYSGSSAGLIDGTKGGVEIDGGSATVVNYGLIKSQGAGVILGAAGSIANFGTIESVGSYAGAHLVDGGYVFNGGVLGGASQGVTNALIAGVSDGIYIGGNLGNAYADAAGTVVNYGTIKGKTGAGVHLIEGGNVANENGGLIQGGAAGLLIGNTSQASAIYSTGGGSTTDGFVDPHWTFTNSGGTTTNAYVANDPGVDFFNGSPPWFPDSAAGSWIVDNTANPQTGGLPLSFSTTFDVADPTIAELSGFWACDDGGELELNGHVIADLPGQVSSNWSTLHPFFVNDASNYFLPGVNTLTVVLTFSDNFFEGALVEITPDAGTVSNSGTITGTGANGIGVAFATAGGTLTNAGTIIGNGGTAVAFTGGSNLLIDDPGAVFDGIVDGGGGLDDTLELAAGSTTGTVSGLGSAFVGFDQIVVDAGAEWQISAGPGSAASPAASGSGASSPALTNDGTVLAEGALVFGAVGEDAGDSGTIQLGTDATVDFTAAVAAGQTVQFSDATGIVRLDDAGAFAGTFAGFQKGDVIELDHLTATGASFANGELTLTDDGTTVATLAFSGSYTSAEFGLSSDGQGGTDISIGAAKATQLFSFVFTYADDDEYYTGTVADDGTYGYAKIAASGDPVIIVRNSAGQEVGFYTIYADGTTREASGAVSVGRFFPFTNSPNGYVPLLTSEGKPDGSAGLGSEADTFTINGVVYSFSDLLEPHPSTS